MFRRYLVDVGCGDYRTGSMPWLFKVYAQRGILFDRVFGTLSDEPAAVTYSTAAYQRFRLLLGRTCHRDNLLTSSGHITEMQVTGDRQDQPTKRLSTAGWEARPLQSAAFWATIPDGLKPVLTWYNVPVDAGANSSFNPLNMIR